MSTKSNIFLAKYSILKPSAKRYLRELLTNQYLSPDELEALSWKRTVKLLSYAYDNVPFYEKRFKGLGFHPTDISDPKYFSQIPVLTRDDLQEHFDSLLSREVSKGAVRLSTTGGSTGQPVKVYHQKNVVRAAAGWRMQSWWDLEPGADFASIYRDLRTDWRSRAMTALLWWPTRRVILNAANLSESEVQRFVSRYADLRPPLVHGYVNALNHVASWILDKGLKVPAPKAIWVTSAPLTSVQKENIERAFNAPVYDQYGCCEIYWLAAQCPKQDGLHMFTDIRRFEIVDDDLSLLDKGKSGQVVVTDLENTYFPLIRYLNGDRGRIRSEPCGCGITLPVMDQVKGRYSDNLVLRDGTQISGEFMTTIFDDDPDLVRQFRVLQHKDYSVQIDVVLNANQLETSQRLLRVKSQVRKRLRDEIPVIIDRVNHIPLKRGKIRFIESQVGLDE